MAAGDPVPPYEVPVPCAAPPKVKVAEVDLNVPKSALTPVFIVKLLLIVVARPNVLVLELVANVRLLKVVATPVILCAPPFSVIVEVLAVKIPLFTQLPAILCVKVLAANVAPVLIVNTPAAVIAPPAVLVPAVVIVRLP